MTASLLGSGLVIGGTTSGRRWRVLAGVQEPLVEVPAVERDAERVPQVAAPGKVFRDYKQGQAMLLLPSLEEWLPAEHLARFVDELVEQHLDLGPLYAAHSNLRGFPPYDPRAKPKGPAPGRWCAHTRPPTAGTTASSSAATSTAMGWGRTEHHHDR